MMNHHAVLLTGNSIEELHIDDAFKMPASDVTHVVLQSFGIDDARSLVEQSFQKPVELEKRVFVVVTKNITSEAQNALLKLFEEPPQTSLFYLVLPHEGVLLPTLRSRLYFENTQKDQDASTEEVDSFLALGYGERIKHVADLAKSKDEESIATLVNQAEVYAQKNLSKNPDIARGILHIRSYIGARGSSNKMLLEELALSLPKL